MKKTIIITSLIILFLMLYFLQTNFFNWFTISGVSPNLFVIFMLFVGLFAGKRLGIPLGVALGLALDFFISKKIGISGIMLGLTGAVRGSFKQKLFQRQSYYHYPNDCNHYPCLWDRNVLIKLHHCRKYYRNHTFHQNRTTRNTIQHYFGNYPIPNPTKNRTLPRRNLPRKTNTNEVFLNS